MAKTKPISFANMVDSDVEEDQLASPDSNQENMGAKRRAGAAAAAKKSVRPKRMSAESIASKNANVKSKPKSNTHRAPLREPAKTSKERRRKHSEEPMQSDEDTQASKRHGEKRKAGNDERERPSKFAKHSALLQKDGEFEYTPTTTRTARRKPFDRPTVNSPTVRAEDSPVTTDFNSSTLHTEFNEETSVAPVSVSRRYNDADLSKNQVRPMAVRRRAGSVLEPDKHPNEATLRRKLGDMARRLESVETKYRNLRELGIVDAEVNYDKLKKQSEANSKAANDLIAALKKELATHKSITTEQNSFQLQLESRDSQLAKSQALADRLSASLDEAQNENKALQVKLENARGSNGDRRISTKRHRDPEPTCRRSGAPLLLSTKGDGTPLSQPAQQLKEDLYGDLTGLIIRGVEGSEDAQIFDCIQTGRNGTLHFTLSVATDYESYGTTEFQYQPRLDADRDRALIELLPDYLIEEITFSRTNAAMFFGRIVEYLTKKRIVEA